MGFMVFTFFSVVHLYINGLHWYHQYLLEQKQCLAEGSNWTPGIDVPRAYPHCTIRRNKIKHRTAPSFIVLYGPEPRKKKIQQLGYPWMILDYAETLPPRGGCWAGTWPSHSACIWDGNPHQFFQNDPNHGPKKQFLTSVRLTIAIFGLMNIQNLRPLEGTLSQPTSLRRIFLRCSAGRSPRPSPHRAKLTRGEVEILWAMNRIPLLMGFVVVVYE